MSHTETRRATTGGDDRVVLTGAAHMPTLAMCDCGRVAVRSTSVSRFSRWLTAAELLRGAYA